MWSHYQNGLSPKNAYKNATEELSKKSRLAPFPPLNTRRGDQEESEGKVIDSLEGIAIFELAIPLRHYFELKTGKKERGWIAKS
jgi:hypothetical protein